ncbi:MAG: sensor histidine kinase [Acidobacteria bacterium]|nr:sensor histidine kinase [Acidobacteriota bacterium]
MPEEVRFLSVTQLLLTTLMVKLAVVAVVATMLVRFRTFRRLLLTEHRAWPERLIFAFAFGVPVSTGVVSRLLLNYNAADLTLAGAFIAGLIAGPYTGVIVGSLAGIPALFAGEFIALPFAIGCGFAGGGLREACPKEAIWQFSPFVFTGLHRRAWRFVRSFRIDWQVPLVTVPISLELLRHALGYRFSDRLFYLEATTPIMWVLTLLAVVLSVAVPIKIWNSARIEHRLQEQEKLLMAAKVEALTSQINPHFLFNTLTSVSSLIRSRPDQARMVVTKLSGLLRRLLHSHGHFSTLREELLSIDEYLDIEAVRFGPNLTIDKQISADTLDVIVPSMILQPLVENSIKHGLTPKVGPGQITIRSVRDNGHTIIEVIDNGAGVAPKQRVDQASTGGIGLKNVNERLRVIYGAEYQLTLESTPGQGTCARVKIPELVAAEQVTV